MSTPYTKGAMMTGWGEYWLGQITAEEDFPAPDMIRVVVDGKKLECVIISGTYQIVKVKKCVL